MKKSCCVAGYIRAIRVKATIRVSKDILGISEGVNSLLSLAASTDGTRLFAADWWNHEIKSVEMKSLSVKKIPSRKGIIALHILKRNEHMVYN